MTILFSSTNGPLAQERSLERLGAETLTIPDAQGRAQPLYAGSFALVIGMSQYTAGWPPLPGVKEDVDAVTRVLRGHGFEVTVANDLDSQELEHTIRAFVAEHGGDPENRLLMYFAGHGHTIRYDYGGEMGYFVPIDAPTPLKDEFGFQTRALAMQRVYEYAKQINSKHALFVFDSCFSGALFASRSIPEHISYRANRPVRQFITSGSADEKVPDDSVFRHEFVDGLEGAADRDEDGYITGAELGDYLQKQVINLTRSAQTPQWGTINDIHLNKGDFVFQLRPSHAQQIKELLTKATDALLHDRLAPPAPDNAADYLHRVLELDPEHQEAASMTGQIVRRYRLLMDSALSSNEIGRAERLLEEYHNLASKLLMEDSEFDIAAIEERIDRARQRIEAEQRIQNLIEKAMIALTEDHLAAPPQHNAVDYAGRVLELSPSHPQAQRIVEAAYGRLVRQAERALQQSDLEQSADLIEKAEGIAEARNLDRKRLNELKLDHLEARRSRVRSIVENLPSTDDRHKSEKPPKEETKSIEVYQQPQPFAAIAPASMTIPPSIPSPSPIQAPTDQIPAEHSPTASLLENCQALLQAQAWTTAVEGHEGTALSCYRQVLKSEPDNRKAKSGIDHMTEGYLNWALQNLERQNLARTRLYLERMALVDPDHPEIKTLNARITAVERAREQARVSQKQRSRHSTPRTDSPPPKSSPIPKVRASSSGTLATAPKQSTTEPSSVQRPNPQPQTKQVAPSSSPSFSSFF